MYNSVNCVIVFLVKATISCSQVLVDMAFIRVMLDFANASTLPLSSIPDTPSPTTTHPSNLEEGANFDRAFITTSSQRPGGDDEGEAHEVASTSTSTSAVSAESKRSAPHKVVLSLAVTHPLIALLEDSQSLDPRALALQVGVCGSGDVCAFACVGSVGVCICKGWV